MSFYACLQRKRTNVPMRFGRSLLMVQPQRAGTSSTNSHPVESAVEGCPQAFHRNAWTRLQNRRKIVDMIGALGVIAASVLSTALPPLPDRGLALETAGGVQLRSLEGRPIVTIPRLDLALDRKVSSYLVMRDRHGRLFTLDFRARAVRRFYEYPQHPAGCRRTDSQLFVCGRTIRDGSRMVARAPRGSPSGRWVWAERAPRGRGLLAQWSGECETWVAYRIANGKLQAYGRESVALGFTPGGAALIHFPNGPCAGDSRAVRGIYSVPLHAKARLILRTTRFAQYAMWGG
jgi:hypothetical protein